jgi:hypothetical protein
MGWFIGGAIYGLELAVEMLPSHKYDGGSVEKPRNYVA